MALQAIPLFRTNLPRIHRLSLDDWDSCQDFFLMKAEKGGGECVLSQLASKRHAIQGELIRWIFDPIIFMYVFPK